MEKGGLSQVRLFWHLCGDMMSSEMKAAAESSDSELVAHSLRGSRDAFGQIVARYQSLVCSLAYSSTGNLTQSEDLAQETFLTAWKQLSQLREPAKLRAWLCGIVRNLSRRIRRGQEREPLDGAAPLEVLGDLPAREGHPLEQAISREEEGILWRSLERIPETYREPLILFYRERRSMAQVALALELSEEAVRQRLARGRRLLHGEVVGFVEGTLEKTSPDRKFTLGVLSALPAEAATAKAAGAGAAIAKGVAAAISGAMLSSLGGLLAVLGGAFLSWRAQADETKSPRERRFFQQTHGARMLAVALLFLAYYFGRVKFGLTLTPFAREILGSAFIFGCIVLGVAGLIFGSQRRKQIQIEDGTFDEAEWKLPREETDAAAQAAGSKSTSGFRWLKLMAFVLGLYAFLFFHSLQKQDLVSAVRQNLGVGVFAAGMVFLSFRSWRKRPRYWSLRTCPVTQAPIVFGLMNLVIFNVHQYQAHASSDIASAASPAEVIGFNVAVAVAYGLFAGIVAWNRRSELDSSRTA
jgi:RNA polymerase sigma factor (sigma-70 family)